MEMIKSSPPSPLSAPPPRDTNSSSRGTVCTYLEAKTMCLMSTSWPPDTVRHPTRKTRASCLSPSVPVTRVFPCPLPPPAWLHYNCYSATVRVYLIIIMQVPTVVTISCIFKTLNMCFLVCFQITLLQGYYNFSQFLILFISTFSNMSSFML